MVTYDRKDLMIPARLDDQITRACMMIAEMVRKDLEQKIRNRPFPTWDRLDIQAVFTDENGIRVHLDGPWTDEEDGGTGVSLWKGP